MLQLLQWELFVKLYALDNYGIPFIVRPMPTYHLATRPTKGMQD